MAGAAIVTSLPPAIWEVATGRAFWPTWQGWLLILYIGLGPSLLAQLMFMRGVQLIGPTAPASSPTSCRCSGLCWPC